MHEMTLAESVLQAVLDAAEGQKVRRIRLQVGRLLMVVPDGLRFSFELLAKGTAAEHAALELEELPAQLRCGACGGDGNLDLSPIRCRHCGAADVEVISGDEVIVDAIELVSGRTSEGGQCGPPA